MSAKMRRYNLLKVLGEGQVETSRGFRREVRQCRVSLSCDQYALVYKAKDTRTNEEVAVKKLKIGSRQEASEGINLTALREIKFLQEIKHPNVIEVRSCARTTDLSMSLIDCISPPATRHIRGTRFEFSNNLSRVRIHEYGPRSNTSTSVSVVRRKSILQNIINNRSYILTTTHIKSYMIMLLTGLEYLHNQWILHRVRSITVSSIHAFSSMITTRI